MRTHDHRAPLAPLLAAVATLGCQNERPPTEPAAERARTAAPAVAEATPAASATVDEVKERPATYYGQRVSLSGEVDELFGDRAFELEGTGWAFDDNITVLTRTPVQFGGGALTSDDELVVIGTVHPFVVAEIERDLGWDLAPELEVRLRERPVLVADSIRRLDDYGTWYAEGAGQPVATVLTIVTTVDPNVLAGQKVELDRERVQSVMGKGLWIGPSHMSKVFVLPQELPEGVEAGDMVEVSGTLQKVPEDAAKAWNLPRTMAGAVRGELLYVDSATVRELPPPTT